MPVRPVRSRPRLVTAAVAVAFAVAGLLPLGQQSATATGSATAEHPVVRAYLVGSWGYCESGDEVWRDLNTSWSSYGQTRIHVNYYDRHFCDPKQNFTLADLEATHADVLILSDPSATHRVFTTDEIEALQTYAGEGHDLLGTFMVFALPKYHIRNSALAPLFGLRKRADWEVGSQPHPTYLLREVKHQRIAGTLFRGLPNPYRSDSQDDNSQVPGDGAWSNNDLAGAKIVARSADGGAAITVYERGPYHAVYVSTMPEYGGGTDDQQLLYNAIIFPRRG